MKSVIVVFSLLIWLTPAFAQNKKKTAENSHKKISERTYFHLKKDTNLIRNINNLQYDSVMIFTFGCPSVIKQLPRKYKYKTSTIGDFTLSEGFVDSTQHWLPLLSDTGKVVTREDIRKILTTFKNVHLDVYNGDPMGCFEPHMGIIFFKDGLVNAHMDVCLTYGQINFEKFRSGHVAYIYNLGILGKTTRTVFTRLGIDYNIQSCR